MLLTQTKDYMDNQSKPELEPEQFSHSFMRRHSFPTVRV